MVFNGNLNLERDKRYNKFEMIEIILWSSKELLTNDVMRKNCCLNPV